MFAATTYLNYENCSVIFLQPQRSWGVCFFFLKQATFSVRYIQQQYIEKMNKFIWAISWQNQQNGMCTQRRLRSACPCEKKLAFLQLLRSSKAAEKLRKSRRYWHLRKSRLLRRAAKKPAFTKLLRNSAEKLQKSRLFYSFYEAFTQSFVKIVMMSKSCGNAAITQVPIPPAFAKLLHAALCRPA